jgi:hypothetical protein
LFAGVPVFFVGYHDAFASDTARSFFTRDFWLGKLAIEETIDNDKRTITFSPILRERLGHHIR